jgi:Tfp pilus assembly ATPase PilU
MEISSQKIIFCTKKTEQIVIMIDMDKSVLQFASNHSQNYVFRAADQYRFRASISSVFCRLVFVHTRYRSAIYNAWVVIPLMLKI